jgi:transcriptional regulator with XRE-family HTH domain
MQIGISSATFTRVEGGRLPDIGTFQKLCAWLKVNPAEILDTPADINPILTDLNAIAAAVHLRADKTLPPEAAADLAELIVVAHAELAFRKQKRQIDVSSWL